MSLRQAEKYCFFIVLLVLCLAATSTAQRTIVRGTITNRFTKERIPFASVSWKRSGQGIISDSAGNFSIQARRHQVDTLLISSVGFQTQMVPLALQKDTTEVIVFLETRNASEVVVKSKYNRGLLWWKKIVANRPVNNPYRQKSYSYELYNKVEVDIDNFSRKKFEQYKLLKPFGFILDNIDSVSEDQPFLPVFITESISDCYFAIHPFREREEMTIMSFILYIIRVPNVRPHKIIIFPDLFIL